LLSAFAVSVILGFLPMILFSIIIYRLDRYEKEPVKLLVFVFLWGAIVSAGGAFIINTLFGAGVYLLSGSEVAANFSVTSIIAPISEEVLKGFTILIVFLVFHDEFDSILDGIIYGAVTALGFAATENAQYIFNFGYLVNGWEGLAQLAFVRIILVGWQHPFYTAFTGIGLAASRMSKNTIAKIISPLLGLIAAIFAHSLHNTIVPLFIKEDSLGSLIFATRFDWFGWFLMLLFIFLMNLREKNILRIYLKSEMNAGIITKEQYHISYSPKLRRIERNKAKAVNHETLLQVKKFYQLCAELAHKKNQYSRLGSEKNNPTIILATRKALYALSSKITI